MHILVVFANRLQKNGDYYDIFGVDRANGVICGNTILCYYYTPQFSYGGRNGEYIKSISKIGGKYITLRVCCTDHKKPYIYKNQRYFTGNG